MMGRRGDSNTSLTDMIADVASREATLTVFNADPAVSETLAEHFVDRNIRIVQGVASDGPSDYAVLSRDGEFVTAVSVNELLATGSASNDERPNFPTDGASPDGFDGSASRRVGRPVLDRLEETMFTSYDRGRMLGASREIEDRAWRVAKGQLHAGFQTLDVFDGEQTTYERLGSADALDVHAYAAPSGGGGGRSSDRDSYTFHVAETPEIRRTWFVAYDGGGVDDAKCVLLAEEREPGRFYGFWSYDPVTVDRVIGHLIDRYGTAEKPGEDGATA